ncbi:hypothetical protein BDA96_03G374300 [Sorghum bicolor]|uniref:Uncharacterized protein n=2 Tax=Sorghum bicolor TaxID=4558 RepID=A0A921RJP5_SORBI|nr:hypothetical protein BDA96_03G374300 [Sorghum bicolor]OQU87814.1 hypothetical protein SORBI_3003G347480 [Sorghum bicolor]
MTGLGMVRVIIKLDVIPRQENRWIERTETLEMSCRAAGHLLYSHAGAATRRMASGFGEVEMSEARASHVISDWVQTEFVSQVASLLFSLQCKRPKASDVQAMSCPVELFGKAPMI